MGNFEEVLALQQLYPQIYLACHVDHVRRKSTAFGLTANESSLLAHLEETKCTTPHDLADYMGVADSTLSAALRRLENIGCINRAPSTKDRRMSLIRLTDEGEVALSVTSVLETKRVIALLATLRLRDWRRRIERQCVGRKISKLVRNSEEERQKKDTQESRTVIVTSC